MRRESQFMLSNQRSPWWPYLLLLAGLFVLSVAVPRGWQSPSSPRRSDDRWSRTEKFGAASRPASTPIAVVRPSPAVASAPPAGAHPPESNAQHSAKALPTWGTLVGGLPIDRPLVEAVAKKIADLRSFNFTNPSPAQSNPVNPVNSAGEISAAAVQTNSSSAGWPKPQSLLAQLDRLSQRAEYHSWASQARELCLDLCRTSDSDPQQAHQALNKLESLYARADALAGTSDDANGPTELRRARYSLERRLLIWRPALSIPMKTIVPEIFVDVNEVLAGLERYETSGLPRDGSRIVEFEEALYTSPEKNAQQLAQVLDFVYRKANVRLAMSNELLGRLASQGIDAAIRRQTFDLLKSIDLEPETINLETSADRKTVRFRLAGPNQLGSHTARPQAPSDSLASLQVHESAINNALGQLQLAGRTFTLPELIEHVAKRLSLSQVRPPANLPPGTSVTFAGQDPVQVHCENGMLRITLGIDELRQGQRRWTNFSIIAAYAPEITPLNVRLVRHGSIELRGDAYHNQPETALRGICNQLLPPERKLELLPPSIVEAAGLAGLKVTQCVIEDGWIGLALGPYHSSAQLAQRVGAEY